jgi:serine/alanine adding enzyme
MASSALMTAIPAQEHAYALRLARVEGDDPHWDDFIQHSPEASFCHLLGWRHVVEDVLGQQYIPLVALTPDGEWHGVLPLVRMRGGPFLGHSLVSMPYLNYGGPLGSLPAQARLVEAAMREAAASRADRVQLRMRVAPSFAPRAPLEKVIVTMGLPDTPEALWEGFPSKLRSQIRRAQKEGMEFRMGRDQLEPFYEVFARNMRDLGTPVYARRFFEAVADTFQEVDFGALYWRGNPVAAGCGFSWRGEFEMTWASSVRDYNRLSPNMLLYWSFMEEMTRRGMTCFNFGRSTPGASTHRFKTQWGGQDVPLGWLTYPHKGAVSTVSTPRRLMSAAWQRLPLTVANLIGPVVAPRLPW